MNRRDTKNPSSSNTSSRVMTGTSSGRSTNVFTLNLGSKLFGKKYNFSM